MAQTSASGNSGNSGKRTSSGAPHAGPQASPLRAIPTDHEAERAVLGAILLDHDALYKVEDKLRPESFDLSRHRVIYRAISELSRKHQALTLLTLRSYLEEQGELENIGGLSALTSLADSVVTAVHVEHHAELVRQKALARALIRICEDIAGRGYDASEPVSQLLDNAERDVLNIAMGRASEAFTPIGEEVFPTIEYLERVKNGEIVGVRTGFFTLDKLIGGLQAGDLTILASRPSMGKTALALNMARNHAADDGGCVAIFSLEMSKRELVMRILLGEAKVEIGRFRDGVVSQGEWGKLTKAASDLQGMSIFLDESAATTVGDLMARARRLHRERQLTLVIVDYIQLIQGRDKAENREQQVADISRSLKLLAKELRLPVLALSQLNRGPEGRPDKRPQLGDLRESGAIEQDADIVMFIYRDDFYDKDSVDAGLAEIHVAKHRNGPVGSLKLVFDRKYALFHDHERTRESTAPEEGFGRPEPGFGLDSDLPFGKE